MKIQLSVILMSILLSNISFAQVEGNKNIKRLEIGSTLSGTDKISGQECHVEVISRKDGKLSYDLNVSIGDKAQSFTVTKSVFPIDTRVMKSQVSKEVDHSRRQTRKVEAFFDQSYVSGNIRFKITETIYQEHTYNTENVVDCRFE